MNNKIALITDTHAGTKNDAQVHLDFQEKFFKTTFFPFLDENQIDTVVHLGDLFDRRKYVNYMTLKRVKTMLFDELEKRHIQTYLILGNHDLFLRQSLQVNAGHLLLGEYENITVIDQPKIAKIKGKYVCMIPWICEENQTECLKVMDECKTDLCFGHFPVNGFIMHVGQVEENGFERDIFKKFDKVLTGHFHHRSTDGTIYYLGNPFELNWNDYDDLKGFHTYDFDTDTLKFIPNPYKMFHRVIYNDVEYDHSSFSGDYKNTFVKVVVEKKVNAKMFEAFLGQIFDKNPFDVKVVENFLDTYEILDGKEFDQSEDTLTLIKKYVDQVNVPYLDSNRLKTLFSDIYNDAQNPQEIQ